MMGLRLATPEDRARVEAFQQAAYARTEAAVGARAIPLEWDYGAVMTECEVWCDEHDGVLTGVLILRVLPDRLFLESIAIAQQAAGSGRGRFLLEATFARARELGLRRVGLITNSLWGFRSTMRILRPTVLWYICPRLFRTPLPPPTRTDDGPVLRQSRGCRRH